jgi:hypothetical protein
MLRRAPSRDCRSAVGCLLHGERAQPLQVRRHEVADLRGEDGEQRGQVVAVPLSCHVGLAEPYEASGAEPAEESGRPVDDHHRIVGGSPAERSAVGQAYPQGQSRRRGGEQCPRHGGA